MVLGTYVRLVFSSVLYRAPGSVPGTGRQTCSGHVPGTGQNGRCTTGCPVFIIHTREIGKYTVERDESVHVLRMVPVSLTRPTNEAFKYVVP